MSTTVPSVPPAGLYSRNASGSPPRHKNFSSGGRSEKSADLNGSAMLRIGGGVPGPPKTIAPASTRSTRPKSAARVVTTLFTPCILD